MISTADYFGPHWDSSDATPERKAAAEAMLSKVNPLLLDAETHGVELEMNPKTGTLVSGAVYGGFRPQDCPEGSPHSAHKEARAVDVYDPHGDLDRWVSDLILAKYDLYREAPLSTGGWCHLSDRAPPSGRRTFQP